MRVFGAGMSRDLCPSLWQFVGDPRASPTAMTLTMPAAQPSTLTTHIHRMEILFFLFFVFFFCFVCLFVCLFVLGGGSFFFFFFWCFSHYYSYSDLLSQFTPRRRPTGKVVCRNWQLSRAYSCLSDEVSMWHVLLQLYSVLQSLHLYCARPRWAAS